MINFDPKKTKVYTAVKWERFFQTIRIFGFLCFVGFLISAFFLWLNESPRYGNPWLVLLVFALISKILFFFFESRLKKPETNQRIEDALMGIAKSNLADFFDFETIKAMVKAMRFDKGLLDSDTLLYFLLKSNPDLQFVFSRALLDFGEIRKRLRKEIEVLREDHREEIVLSSLKVAQRKNHDFVQKGDVLIALSQTNSFFRQLLVTHDLYPQDIENIVWWLEILEKRREKAKRFWDYDNLLKMGSIGRDLAAGYTITLDQFSTDWTDVIRKRGYEEIIGRDEEIKKVERVLVKKGSNNVILLGDSGTGRKSIVHALAKRVLFGKSLPSLNYQRIVELDLIRIFSVGKTTARINALLERIFQEVVLAKNIILIIDELPNFVIDPRESGMVNISAILLKYLPFSQFRLIATTDYASFHKHIEPNLALSSLFERVEVREISEQQTIFVLESLVPLWENKHKKFITYPAIRDAVKYCSKFLPNIPFPKKAIDLLEETVVHVSTYTKSKVVLPEHVARMVSEKTNIPVGELEKKEKDILLNLEDLIHKRIINQNEAVREVSVAMRRARAEITIRKGPIGAFLFLGPTGVGKTETSKALTEIYFGNEDKMIRIDMSEFQTKQDIPRLIGGKGHEGLLTSEIRERPFSLVLLDEIEKAHPDILNLFLQVIDDGHITDGFGRRVDFKNAIIIATSNAGYKVILKALEQKADWLLVRNKLLNYLFEHAIFRPEFINRFDAVVVFTPLTRENLLDISQLMLNKLKKNLAQKYIELEITDELKERIVELGYNPMFGAREMRRVIQDKVESVLANALLSEQLTKGDRIRITKDFQIVKVS
jgi:ATP-dependent Clp protease ATP-binding subunit ClpC